MRVGSKSQLLQHYHDIGKAPERAKDSLRNKKGNIQLFQLVREVGWAGKKGS